MLHSTEVIDAVASVIENDAAGIPIILDPVMIAKGGHPLLASDAIDELKRRLIPMSAVLTPNVPEAEAITGIEIADINAMETASRKLIEGGTKAVLLKGGHLPGKTIFDVLLDARGDTSGEIERFTSLRIVKRRVVGYWCRCH